MLRPLPGGSSDTRLESETFQIWTAVPPSTVSNMIEVAPESCTSPSTSLPMAALELCVVVSTATRRPSGEKTRSRA